MILTHEHRSKILEGPVSLGRSCIDAASLTIDPHLEVGADVSLNARAGTVERSREDLPSGPYNFGYEHFRAADFSITANESQIVADGIEEVTLSITTEDTVTATFPLLVVDENGAEVGVIDVSLVMGLGQHVMTIAQPGRYRFLVDNSVVDATWNLSKFRGFAQISMIAKEV